MPGVKGRAVFIAVAAAAVAGTHGGCGGSLTRPISGDGGTTGLAGTGAPAGRGGMGGAAGRGGMGGAGRGGTTGAAGTSGGGLGQPACPAGVTRLSPCASSDLQWCYTPCGPERQGGQALTCISGFYNQASFCAFDPSEDFSCYAIPTAPNAACPAGVTPQASQSCNVPHCTLCNTSQGVFGGQYLDSSGAAKIGYCVCQPPDANGARTWSCATDLMWPCPGGAGCG